MMLFSKIKHYIEENNIYIHYYCYRVYHIQVAEFNQSPNVIIKEYNPELHNNFHQLWIADKYYLPSWNDRFIIQDGGFSKFNKYYLYFYNKFLALHEIPITIEQFGYEDPDLLQRSSMFATRWPEVFEHIDVLILNSTPQSGQYTKNNADWNAFVYKMNKKYRVITTEPVQDILCTQNYYLSIKDIAALSTQVKKVVAVNSGVLCGLFNTYTMENVDVIYYFDDDTRYVLPKLVHITDINTLYENHF
jgi:hypothetical protein